jgi:hypothetical protein
MPWPSSCCGWWARTCRLAQCTIFSFEQPNRPRIVAMGDRSRTSALPRIAQAYVTRFFRLDPALAVVPGVQAVAGLNDRHSVDSPVTLHRQRPQDITHPEYRQVCYELPQVAERLALLARYEGRFWMSVNFYRGVEHGPFDDAGVAIVQAFAPTIQFTRCACTTRATPCSRICRA